jgi:hypothetical protein
LQGWIARTKIVEQQLNANAFQSLHGRHGILSVFQQLKLHLRSGR